MATHGLPIWPWTEALAEDLPPAEALLLDAMRRWSEAAGTGRPALVAVRMTLVVEDLAPAAPSLDSVLRCAPFRLANPLQPYLEGDEPALLLALALAQRGPRRECLAAFLRLLPPALAYQAMGHALCLAQALRRGGLLLAHPLR